ncbi:YihY/virulence factor BrkB family protein [Motilibacter deserti]|uniref:YihY/virulence factor BrkB family protein n=1 Tax=Motilibacter deserti TaxID=2714956 RepID=UPI002F2B2129
MSTGAAGRAAGRVRTSSARAVFWRLLRGTIATCFRYRVTGLAAEAGFFALLSLPPLVLGLVGALGYVDSWLGSDTVLQVQTSITNTASDALTQQTVDEVITPMLDDVLRGGRPDIISIGFLLALWSGSRALNVYVDTVTIMYGLSGHRGIVRTRALSFTLYVLALVLGTAVIPLVIAGPGLVGKTLPEGYELLQRMYWPIVLLVSVLLVASLYHIAVPVRTPFRRDVPGAALAVALWVVLSFALRWVIRESVGGTSIYGPLTAPIVVLVWLYFLAIAVLIGAAMNAAWDEVWPLRAVAEERRRPVAHPAENPLTPVPGDR